MAVIIEEKWESRERTDEFGEGKSAIDLIFVATGSDDDEEITTQLLLDSPVSFRGLQRASSSIERIAQFAWLGTVTYGDVNIDEKQVGGSEFQFDTAGQSQNIRQSLSTARFNPDPSNNPATKGIIGDNGDFVEGVDIIIPTYSFSETHVLDNTLITPAYKSTLFFLTGTTNDAVFKGFQIGEVLYLGSSGSKRQNDRWSISYRFSASPNILGVTKGPVENINKRGWEFLDIRYLKKAENFSIIHDIKWVDVHRVYPDGDFSLLGIGV